MFRDANETPFYTIPAGTSIAAGGYFTLEEAAFGFGLGAMESARIYNSSGTLVDSQSWTAHAATTYGRCPNGSGALRPAGDGDQGRGQRLRRRRGGHAGGGAAGAGGGAAGTGGGAAGTGGSVATLPWPGDDAVVTVDAMNQFASNLSGLNYQPATATSPAVLWAVLNGPSTAVPSGVERHDLREHGHGRLGGGQALHYTTGTGGPTRRA